MIIYKTHDINGVIVIDLPFDKVENLSYCEGVSKPLCNSIKINYSRKYILIKETGCSELAFGEEKCKDKIIGAAKLTNNDIDDIKNILSNDNLYNNKIDDSIYISKDTSNALIRFVKK